MASTITIAATNPTSAVVGTDEVTVAAVLQHLQRVKLFDGTVGGTNAAAVDTANRLTVTEPDQLGTGTITTASSFAALAVGVFSSTAPGANTFVNQAITGLSTVGIQIIGTWAVQPLQFEGTADGTNWTPIYASPNNLVGVQVSSCTLQGLWRVSVAGLRTIRVRAPLGTTFSANPVVTFTGSASPSVLTTQLAEDDGLGNVKVTLGTALDSNVDRVSIESTRPTYRSAAIFDSAGANGGLATSVSALNSTLSLILGSVTRTIRVTRVQVQGTATAAAYVHLVLRFYSSLYSGGTGGAVSGVQVDSNDAAATGVAIIVTGALTEGTSTGNVESGYIFMPAIGTPALTSPPRDLIPYGGLNDKPVTLRGTQYLALGLGVAGALPAGYRLYVNWEWTESTT